MAICKFGICTKCFQERPIWENNVMCHQCLNEHTEEKRLQHFQELDKLTIEERIRRLEEIDYNNKVKLSRTLF